MSNNLKILSILFLILIAVVITLFVRKNKISIKYSLIWYFICFILTIFTLFPHLLGLITNFFGIQVASNMIFAIMIGGLFIICISLTIIVSIQKEQIKNLIQEISIIKTKLSKEK